jgi:radical SAM superfamily enzyme YgiQ (UPF0313 family)
MRPIVHFIIPEGPHQGSLSVYRPVLPRGVLQVARAAEAAGWVATVLDGYSAPGLLHAYLQALAEHQGGGHEDLALPAAVGISLHGPPSVEPALAIAARLREIEPSLPLLFGGQLANAGADLLLPLLPERSILLCGDGDFDIAPILEATLAASGEARLMRRLGVHPWESLPDLDLVLPRYADYLAEPDFEHHLETQIGCPYRCFHCGTGRQGLYARTMNRPIEAIQAEFDQIVQAAATLQSPLPRLWITDETFGSDPVHALAFCEAMLARKERWSWRAQSRADVISEELLLKMREAGCSRLAFGVEIPNDAGLDLLGKREAMQDIVDAFALCNHHAVVPEAICVVGTPGDPTRLGDFLEVLDALGTGSVQAYIYHPIPGSPWWKKHGAALRDRRRQPGRWSDLDFHSPPVDASPSEMEQAVIAFLALQAWRPPSNRRAAGSHPPLKTWTGACTQCGDELQSNLLFAHSPTGIEVRRYSGAIKRHYLVTTPEHVTVLEMDPARHRNLYCGLFSMGTEALSLPLCARCLINKKRPESPSPAVVPRFLAI